MQRHADEAETGRKGNLTGGFKVIMYNGYVFFIRERAGYFWLVDDSKPEVALRLPGVFCQQEAERLAWTLVNDRDDLGVLQ